jgi:hypothetical protein
MIREHPGLSCIDYTVPGVDIPAEPHFILTNHIYSPFGIGSYLGMAFIAKAKGCKIVCYKDYSRITILSGTLHQILHNEIVIDKAMDRDEKERVLVEAIRETFAKGQNVLWFVDGSGAHAMRSLTKKVLGYFPETQKQLVHIRKLSQTMTFGYQRYPATTDLDQIIAIRTEIHGREGR